MRRIRLNPEATRALQDHIALCDRLRDQMKASHIAVMAEIEKAHGIPANANYELDAEYIALGYAFLKSSDPAIDTQSAAEPAGKLH